MESLGLESDIQLGRDVAVPSELSDWLSRPKPLWIGGKPELSSKLFQSINPASESVLAQISEANQEHVNRAVSSARKVFESGVWSKKSQSHRAAVLGKIADCLEEHRSELAILESLDTGKPIRESFEGDIPRAAQNFRFFASYDEREEIRYENPRDVHRSFREPIGTCVLITPWNLPLYLESWKLAPALLMGNSCILKPSELTPLTAAYFVSLIEKKGLLPPGVLQLLHGFGENSAGAMLTSHPDIDAISFTGETDTGRAIMRSAAVGPTRVSFELGGKGASVVFEDADLDAAISTITRAAFRNQGQICLASPRIYIHNNIYATFKERFLSAVDGIKVGPPLSGKTTMGALISGEHRQKVESYIRRVEPPAEILCGGERPKHLDRGFFLEPTVIEGLSDSSPLTCEEIFGPVASLYSFSEDDEVVNRVNATPYGLSCSVWTRDDGRAQRVSEALRMGLVWVNAWFLRDLRVPFGGQKRSGLGREGGTHSLDFFSEWKSVSWPARKEG